MLEILDKGAAQLTLQGEACSLGQLQLRADMGEITGAGD
jgi:hypothetical protein